MRRWRSQKPCPLSGTLFGFVIVHITWSILGAPLIFPRSSNPLSPPVIAFVTSTDPVKTALCQETWLKHLHSYTVFSSRKNGDTNQILLPYSPGSLWSSFSTKALFAEHYLPHYFSWYIITTDDTYVLVDDLMQELAAFDSDEPYLAVIGPTTMKQKGSRNLHAVVVASKGAMVSLWDKIQTGSDGCTVSSGPNSCLDDVVHLNLRQDVHERYRFHVMKRHFSKYEMRDYTYGHNNYNDGEENISSLSDSLICVHNLTAEDFRIFDILFNRIKVSRKQ